MLLSFEQQSWFVCNLGHFCRGTFNNDEESRTCINLFLVTTLHVTHECKCDRGANSDFVINATRGRTIASHHQAGVQVNGFVAAEHRDLWLRRPSHQDVPKQCPQ